MFVVVVVVVVEKKIPFFTCVLYVWLWGIENISAYVCTILICCSLMCLSCLHADFKSPGDAKYMEAFGIFFCFLSFDCFLLCYLDSSFTLSTVSNLDTGMV